MKFIQKNFLHFLRYHSGYTNIGVHLIGISMLIFGIYFQSTLLFILSFFIEEIGHIYNFHLHGEYRGKHEFHPIKNLITQGIFVLPFVFILYFICF